MRTPKQLGWVLGILLVFSAAASAQTVNGAITGVVKDSSGAVVKDVALTLRNIATDQVVGTTISGQSGEYAFRNLAPAKYAVDAVKDGFQQVTHPDIEVTLSSVQRVEITLPIGTQEQRVEVVGGSSVLSVTGAQEHGISPETLQQLPLLMNSGPRAAAGFAILMPGVSTGGGANAFDARINGGLQSGDEASVDGVSMQQG
ncbi:MAG TPA: carboxypeptidase-like regulatory domain-containing protein, partial [Vicinamibacterales bacterium]|nr:carboxypeptidase-like regulatory domain-containing protein [Vicinamibacterales bacterium]